MAGRGELRWSRFWGDEEFHFGHFQLRVASSVVGYVNLDLGQVWPRDRHWEVGAWLLPWPGFLRKQSLKRGAPLPSFYFAEPPQRRSSEGVGRSQEEEELAGGIMELAPLTRTAESADCGREKRSPTHESQHHFLWEKGEEFINCPGFTLVEDLPHGALTLHFWVAYINA